MKYQIFVSFIVYVHNGEGKAARFLKTCDSYLHNNFESYEIVLVNDGSTDNTIAEVESVMKDVKGNAILINLPWKHGVEPAMTAGLHRSVGDFVFERDNLEIDFSEELLVRLYETATLGFDIVSAAPNAPLSFTSKMFYKFINRVSYVNLNMSSETIRLASRRSLNAMLNLKEKFRYRKALYLLTGYPNKSIAYEQIPGYKGTKKRVEQENIDLALDVVIGFSNIGIKAIHLLSALLFLFSIGVAGFTIYNYLFVKDIVEGWASILLFLSSVFSGLFFILGILGEYILRILNEVKGRPYYTISSIKVFSESTNTALSLEKIHNKNPIFP
ncbi:MAG: glycosyltransferase [Deltaproteobacteria bacterium]|nr:glycosyltransferase [Deltaproteobacteria bacterium]